MIVTLIAFLLSICSIGHGQQVDTPAIRSIVLQKSLTLQPSLVETSGLILWDHELWSQNDSRDTHLYRVDPENGNILSKVLIPGVENRDWEDIAQDEKFIYIGDFGNNPGTRQDLHILRIPKATVKAGKPASIARITFSYPEQKDFSRRLHAHDFDCEAMIVRNGSIFLFTKNWESGGMSMYSLPATPGEHKAQLMGSISFEGVITGADLSPSGKTLALSGYNAVTHPFLIIFRDATPILEKKQKLEEAEHIILPLPLPFHQVEGIALKNDMECYISNELFQMGTLINTGPGLHAISFAADGK